MLQHYSAATIAGDHVFFSYGYDGNALIYGYLSVFVQALVLRPISSAVRSGSLIYVMPKCPDLIYFVDNTMLFKMDFANYSPVESADYTFFPKIFTDCIRNRL